MTRGLKVCGIQLASITFDAINNALTMAHSEVRPFLKSGEALLFPLPSKLFASKRTGGEVYVSGMLTS